ncbi:MAG: hypothetical protein PHH67_06780 [Methanosarcina sp.]|nr:hypothetical protein [Methanosarcina sp.]MDD4306202.1 hypothetical protein [Methanosarcina sp.]MDD4619657.1 hypothetical protein [Methanosarcina sp.]NLN43025.1 hypothetical protein [Methanosarcina sp.]
MDHEAGVITTLFKKSLTTNFFKKSLIKNANLFRKGLIENSVTFGFECLIPKPYPAWSTGATVAVQRLRCKVVGLFFATVFCSYGGVCFEFSVRIAFEG